jgi:crotonobetainyl-CoA:carnitine CoA-transferase CaiB-like acyl-CoA transferase
MTGPFGDVRVLETSRGQAARMAGMLLADLGADVVRVLPDGLERHLPGQASPAPQDLAWDRGKRFAASDQLSALAQAADVLLSDAPWEEGTGFAGRPGLIRVWMPPHAATGQFAALPDDPVLRSALGGFAANHPSLLGRPVASVVPTFTAVHAAMGASAAAAALLRSRTGARGDTVVVSGLHAMAACLCSMAITGLDVAEVYSTGNRIPGAPNFRAYQAADGRWLYLAALSPELFIRALAVLDRVDVMLLPGVDGEFTNILVPQTGMPVGSELEKTFATRTCAEWLADLTAGGIPVAPVATRAEWLAGSYHDGLVTLDHPALGPVTMPAIPVRLSVTPGEIRNSYPERARPTLAPPWPARLAPRLDEAQGLDESGREGRRPPSPVGRPLAGLRVVDLSTFLAAPFVSSLLADYGAEVVKVERPGGDPYHVYAASYAAVNQRKTIGILDLRDPAARDVLLAVVRDADVLIDNLPASAMERLGLGEAELAAVSPALVRCSVSAFGRSGAHADLPGFDPVLQSLSGLAAAQGGTDVDSSEKCRADLRGTAEDTGNLPVPTSAPVHDVATGALGALGVLAALYEKAGGTLLSSRPRLRGGDPPQPPVRGQHVTVSLAASAGFLQLAEMTTFEGRPHTATGSLDYPGPSPTRRLYRAADGWLAVAARTGEEAAALLSITGTADPAGLTGPDGLVGALAEAFAARPVGDWLDVLAEYEVPACPVIERERALWDPRLAGPGEPGLTHIVRDPHIGRLRVVRTYADWAAAPDVPVPDRRLPGEPPAGPSASEPSAGGWRRHVAATLEAAGTLAAPFAIADFS